LIVARDVEVIFLPPEVLYLDGIERHPSDRSAGTAAIGSGLIQKLVDSRPERGQVLLDDGPDNIEVNAEVVVNDLVAQACDLFPGNLRML
jgi:hypothetical protein